ncbi:hypothetical protein CAEBREN_08948 [Caenorhabditis brenneri]|uniref:Guanylate cyclase n=1 Tax=Caenorhabditis brenneri TaxID=135651 RepID=G0NLP8_CAEBE|nr:hypothetical protein CAEBREN_08948 [Caenorhabditis brenneri]
MDVIWKVLSLFILFYEVDGQLISTYNGTANSTAGSRRTIKVGIAAAQQIQTGSIGWSVCGGAVPLAIEKLKQAGYAKNFDFELGFAAAKMLQQYRWGRIAMLYYQSDLDYCSKVMDDVEATFNDQDTPVNIVIKAEMYLNDDETTDIVLQSVKSRARSMTGEVVISTNLTRMSIFQLYGLNAQYDQAAYINFTFINDKMSVSVFYKDEATTVWHFYGYSRPLDTPICGFLGKSCPVSFWEQYRILIVVAIILILLLMVLILVGCCCMISSRRAEQERINSEWQIPFLKLLEPEKRQRAHGASKRSLQSAPSTATGDSRLTAISDFCENYTIMVYEKDMVLTAKHQYTHLTKADMERFVKLRTLEHENLNKFIGLSIDSSHFIAVSKLCSRGSLQDILSRGNFSMDYFFMFCIIRDVAKGMDYLHKSFLRLHGNLRSATCLVNDSWQVKLAEYGLDNLDEEQTPPKKRLLWVAPEVLRGSLSVSQMDSSADVYSFAIIASEILTRKEAWDFLDRKEDCEEIVYMVKKGGPFPIRPEIVTDIPDVNPTLISLVKDCWAENPEDRPTANSICTQLKSMMPKSKSNLMDHVFNMLEEYTATLEVEIEDRTKELTLEKKKADLLLSRMLPQQIVDMSLRFMEYCSHFKIPHLPREKVELRIGINSGPCVAGVVGLSMPRYCLFGDTVNTASRMESNGKPSMIHMTADAYSLLITHYPHQYETSSRGEVIIKGKGVMETYWVLGKVEDYMDNFGRRETLPVHELVEFKPEPILKQSANKKEEVSEECSLKGKEIRSVSSHSSRSSSVFNPLKDHREFKMEMCV